VGDKVVSMLVLDVGVAQLFRRIDFFTFVGVSRVCSSHSTHGVFSPAWLDVVSSWLGGVVWAFSLLYRFYSGFLLINQTTLFFLINEKAKLLPRLKKYILLSEFWQLILLHFL
jgi:hypothetical protein